MYPWSSIRDDDVVCKNPFLFSIIVPNLPHSSLSFVPPFNTIYVHQLDTVLLQRIKGLDRSQDLFILHCPSASASSPTSLGTYNFNMMEHRDIEVCETSSIFRCYYRGDPIEVDDDDTGLKPTIIFLHGGGHTALTWALSTCEFMKLSGPDRCRCLCLDLPGHGHTRTANDDLSMDNLICEVLAFLRVALPPPRCSREYEAASNTRRPLVLVGHSLGGAIAIRLAGERLSDIGDIKALVVVDIVEGSVLQSMSHMHKSLSELPREFRSAEEAVSWSVNRGIIKNMESARISVPAQLKKGISADGSACLVWITNLLETEKYWTGWFLGLSDLFLSVKAPKLLQIANYDRLDTPLTAAQMMGALQVEVIGSNHFIHEEHPLIFARSLFRFLCRHGVLRGGGKGGKRASHQTS